MSFCINCGQQIVNGSKFCANCGESVNQINATTDNERKTVYEGEIHKCPHCGEVLKAFETTCPTCKFEIRGTKVTSAVSDFAQKLEKIDLEEKRVELIKNFYIPNTKEDIYEFFIHAMSNLNVGGKELEAWQVKLEQTYHKAKLSFGNTKEFDYIENLYKNTIRENKKREAKNYLRKKWKILLSLFFGGVSIAMMAIGVLLGEASGDPDSAYYALVVLGIFPLGAIAFIALYSLENKHEQKKKQKNNFLGDIWDSLKRK